MSRSGKGRGRTWSGGPGGSDRWLRGRRSTPAALRPLVLPNLVVPAQAGIQAPRPFGDKKLSRQARFLPNPPPPRPAPAPRSTGVPPVNKKPRRRRIQNLKPPRPGASACRADHGRILRWHLWPSPRQCAPPRQVRSPCAGSFPRLVSGRAARRRPTAAWRHPHDRRAQNPRAGNGSGFDPMRGARMCGDLIKPRRSVVWTPPMKKPPGRGVAKTGLNPVAGGRRRRPLVPLAEPRRASAHVQHLRSIWGPKRLGGAGHLGVIPLGATGV